MSKYSDSQEWEDIVPIPQNDGCPNPLAAIAYTEEYSEAMSYLRAVMADNEKSPRVLGLTEDIIRLNPAHYTVWLYRASVVFAIKRDFLEELEWLNKISFKHLKNYQIWHHRQTLMTHLTKLPENELPFLSTMLDKDAKNYHVWSYRQWLVRHFSLWDTELPFIDSLLVADIRNNSAWNHRWFVVFAKDVSPTSGTFKDASAEPEVVEREIEYAKEAIRKAPQNQSPWSYLRGVVRAKSKTGYGGDEEGLRELKGFAEGFADVEREDEVRSSWALDLLAEVYSLEEGQKEKAGKVLDLLGRRYDPIRRNYWEYRKGLLRLQV